MRPSVALWSLLPLVLTGCAITSTAPPTPQTGPALQGVVHGGQQPIVGAHIYLFAANTTGYGGNGIAPSAANASISLLNATTTGLSDSIGAYVLTDANGQFSITNDYTCTPASNGVPAQQVYLYSLGGQPTTGTTNNAAGLLAVLGSCPTGGTFAGTLSYLYVNEVSTIAAAYAMAGFASDATHVSSSGTTLAQTGIANAFANANQLYNLQGSVGGIARATTPAGNGTVPQTTIDTLANILAACINTNGTITGPINPTACYTLLNNAQSSGSSGTVPTDTATAAINIAHNPGSNITNLYGLPGTSPPFGPALSGQPNDFTIRINFTGGGLAYPGNIAIDAAGNAWIANGGSSASTSGNVTELSSTGAAVLGSPFTYGVQGSPQGIAIDQSGYVWLTNFGTPGSGSGINSEPKLSSSGQLVAGSPFPGISVQNLPEQIQIDAFGNAWIAENIYVEELSSSGTVLSDTDANTAYSSNVSLGVSIDGSGNVWVAYAGSFVAKLSSTGVVLGDFSVRPPLNIAVDGFGNVWVPNRLGSVSKITNSGAAASGSPFAVGGFVSTSASSIAIDGAGSPWITNETNGSLTHLSNVGAALSPSTGYTGTGTAGSALALAIDGSGDIWINGYATSAVIELIGIATPVITPIAAGLPTTPTTDGSSSLGTRP